MSQYLVDRFNLAFKAGLINRFGRIPAAEKFTIEFNFRNYIVNTSINDKIFTDK